MAQGQVFLYSAAMALLAFAFLLPTAETKIPERSSAGAGVAYFLEILSFRHRSAARDLQVAAMREIHQKLLVAPSPKGRVVIVAASTDVMSRGVIMMRKMRSALQTDAIGGFVSETITEAHAEDVPYFLGLMSLLIEMKGDQEDCDQSAKTAANEEVGADWRETAVHRWISSCAAPRLIASRACISTMRLLAAIRRSRWAQRLRAPGVPSGALQRARHCTKPRCVAFS